MHHIKLVGYRFKGIDMPDAVLVSLELHFSRSSKTVAFDYNIYASLEAFNENVMHFVDQRRMVIGPSPRVQIEAVVTHVDAVKDKEGNVTQMARDEIVEPAVSSPAFDNAIVADEPLKNLADICAALSTAMAVKYLKICDGGSAVA